MIDFTSIAADQPVNAVAGIPAVTWAADPTVDEIHVRLSRNVSAADPVTDPGIHHLGFIQQLVTG